MAGAETTTLRKIMKLCSRVGARLFRNQVGHYLLMDGRRVTSGLCPGSSDLIGWVPVVITPAMVGRKVAVFTAIEVKTKTGRVQDNQENFIEQVNLAGGIGGVIREENDALDLINNYCMMPDK